MKEVLYIDKASTLADLVSELSSGTFVALDTEFVREKTYYPKLCLVQLANDKLTACIDPLRIEDLSELLALLTDNRVEKTLHSARQDLEVIFQAAGQMPSPIFDTQLAASMVGHDIQTGYAALVDALLGIQLSKAHTRTDWARRPLSNEQIHYAADDVRYLVPVYHRLRDELIRLDRLEWLQQEVEHLTDRSLYDIPPQEAWKKIKGARKLNGHELGAVKRLAEWRERRAIARNRPRQWVIKDYVVLEFAKVMPETREELQSVSGMPDFLVKRHSRDLLEISEQVKGADLRFEPMKKPPRLTAQQKACLAEMSALVAERGEKKGIHPDLLVTRKELKLLLHGDRTLNVLRHWRYDVVGKELLGLVDSLN